MKTQTTAVTPVSGTLTGVKEKLKTIKAFKDSVIASSNNAVCKLSKRPGLLIQECSEAGVDLLSLH